MNTLEYIEYKKLNTDNLADWVKDVNWSEKDNKGNPILWIKRFYEFYKDQSDDNISILLKQEEKEKEKKITIKYSKNLSPDLLRIETTTNDGTLMFSYNKIGKLLEPLVLGQTYCTLNVPEDYHNNFFDYDVIYTVGDLLWNFKFIDHVDEEHGKMFPGQTDVFAIAVKVEYIKNK